MLSNNSKSGALERANRFGTPTYHVSSLTEPSPEALGLRMASLLREYGVELLVLAGYMKLLPESVLRLLPNRIVNIHPALLPAFGGQDCYGSKVHEKVIQSGSFYSGITVHLVTERYDEGMILLQKALPVPAGCTAPELAARVLELEHAWYWQVIQGYADGSLIPAASADALLPVEASRFWARHREQ